MSEDDIGVVVVVTWGQIFYKKRDAAVEEQPKDWVMCRYILSKSGKERERERGWCLISYKWSNWGHNLKNIGAHYNKKDDGELFITRMG